MGTKNPPPTRQRRTARRRTPARTPPLRRPHSPTLRPRRSLTLRRRLSRQARHSGRVRRRRSPVSPQAAPVRERRVQGGCLPPGRPLGPDLPPCGRLRVHAGLGEPGGRPPAAPPVPEVVPEQRRRRSRPAEAGGGTGTDRADGRHGSCGGRSSSCDEPFRRPRAGNEPECVRGAVTGGRRHLHARWAEQRSEGRCRRRSRTPPSRPHRQRPPQRRQQPPPESPVPPLFRRGRRLR